MVISSALTVARVGPRTSSAVLSVKSRLLWLVLGSIVGGAFWFSAVDDARPAALPTAAVVAPRSEPVAVARIEAPEPQPASPPTLAPEPALRAATSFRSTAEEEAEAAEIATDDAVDLVEQQMAQLTQMAALDGGSSTLHFKGDVP